MRVLITGITGFVGSHMADFALARGAEVFGSYRWRSKTENIDHLGSRVTLIESDLRDLSSVRGLVETSNPDWVVHLAAQSFVGTSWQTPAETLSTNIISQVNLLEAIRGFKMFPRFLAVGTSEEYGLVNPEELPIKETNPLRPLSPYAVSKVAQDMMGWQYFKSYGLPIVRSRAFNHEGPRRGDVFVTSSFARQVAETSRPVATTPTCATSCAATGRCSSRASRARSTISAPGARGPSGRSSTSCSASRP
jgi:GDP-4-dehydro-6-deoxy-D-mannose reductase